MSESPAPLPLRRWPCVNAVQSSMPTQKAEHWFFPPLPWITRLDRLGCLPEFDCFPSLLAVCTDLGCTSSNSKCLQREREREKWTPGALRLPLFTVSVQTGWLIIKCLMFNQADWMRRNWGILFQLQSAWDLIESNSDFFCVFLTNQTGFGKVLTVPCLDKQWQLRILH